MPPLGAVAACEADSACLSGLKPSGGTLQALEIWHGCTGTVFGWDTVGLG